jgi:hypothetical protein
MPTKFRAAIVRTHVKYFLFYNLFYFAPLAWVAAYEFSQNEISQAAAVNWQDLRRVTILYVLGCATFCLGSGFRDLAALLTGEATGSEWSAARLPLHATSLGWASKVLVGATVMAFVTTKILLIPLGVYSSYAFDTGQMVGGLWTASMVLSELLVLFSFAALFSRSKRNVLWFAILSGIDGINLLHGTRIFFIVAALGFSLYLYLQRKLTWRVGILGLAAITVLGYLVFVMRTSVDSPGEGSWVARLLVPIMAESVFSQLSLLAVIRDSHLWTAGGAIPQFLHDNFYFLMPRVLLPNKDSMLYIDNFSDLSPLGAFSGYAQGLIYFGYWLPFVYFVLGMVADWLARRASFSRMWSLVYVYFTCDFLFRIMRDGYIIPIKMLLDSLIVLGAIYFAELLFPSQRQIVSR